MVEDISSFVLIFGLKSDFMVAGGVNEIVLWHVYLRLMSRVNSINCRVPKTMLCGRSWEDMVFFGRFVLPYEWTIRGNDFSSVFLTSWHICFVNADFFFKVSTGICSCVAFL